MLRDRGEHVPERPPAAEKPNEPEPPAAPAFSQPPSAVTESTQDAGPTAEKSASVPASADLPPVETLKDQILGALRKVRHSLAAAMEKAELWEISGTTLNLTFKTTFEISFLEKERHEIEKIILESLNYTLHLKTQLRKQEEESSQQLVEEQVELVRSVFRGTIMKRSES